MTKRIAQFVVPNASVPNKKSMNVAMLRILVADLRLGGIPASQCFVFLHAMVGVKATPNDRAKRFKKIIRIMFTTRKERILVVRALRKAVRTRNDAAPIIAYSTSVMSAAVTLSSLTANE